MLLSVENLSAGYGDLQVLRSVTLNVQPGEFVLLIGPNGAGKSTILKSIFNLTRKMAGTIQFQEKDVTHLPTHGLIEEGIGFVPQGRLVFPSLTVKENLDMGGYLLNHRATLEENRERVYDLFPALREKRRELAGNLSGGQQQQLSIGRALMMTPKLLLLDEPSLGLSPKLVQEVFSILKKLQEQGTTLLVVEQNVRLALPYADRGYLLSAGRVRFAGTRSELASEDLMRDAFLA